MSHTTANDYSESGFLGFIRKWGRKAGREILKNAGIPESKLVSKPTMLEAARAAVALSNGK